MTEVKICGLTDPAMTRHAAAAGADWIGFNFVEGSPRQVSLPRADLCLPETGFARAIALVVDASDQLIGDIGHVGLSSFQLHGQETPARVAEIKGLVRGEVWKVLSVATAEDLAGVDEYEAADRFLIDAKPPEGEPLTGGHGEAFDWDLLEGWQSPKPWFLAGGLTPENVAGAIAATGAPGVDVSSGVEASRGVKDADLISAFIKAAKGT